MLTGFKETHLQIKKSVPAEPKRYALFKRREAPHFSMDLSSAFGKKVGDFKKKESESLIFTGLEIPRDYYYDKEELKVGHHLEGTGFYI